MLHDKDLIGIQEARTKVESAYAAFQKFRSFTQEQVDHIVDCMAQAGRANAGRLARLAVEETGYGNVQDKTAKNLLCSDTLYQAIKSLKTAGIVREDPARKLLEIAEPVGVVAAIVPTTNPTSTALFKILISLKGRNTIVISPHPRAVRCTCEASAVLYRAAIEAGAPENVIQCLESPSLDATTELMRHRRTGIILSTGGQGIVRAAYSSGKPAIGVGPGNVPVLVERSADVQQAVRMVVEGKSFDYGTVCSSEQSLVAEEAISGQVLAELQSSRAFLCDASQAAALARLLITSDRRVNPQCVGQAAAKIAAMAGFAVPSDTAVLVVRPEGAGREHPLSLEKLSPVLSLYFAPDFEAGMKLCETLLHLGGLGHTCVIHSRDDAKIREFALRMPAMRVLVNTPSPQGSTGITTNVFPSMTLGCGAMAGNITGDNIGPLHLINIKRVAYQVRQAEAAFASPEGRALFAAGQTEGAEKPWEEPTAVSAPLPVRPNIADAVERYLASRGLRPSPTSGLESAEAAPSSAAALVDRFLASRRPQTSLAAPAANPQPAPPGDPPGPPVTVVDFVSESDVRQAIREGRKIFICSKTIVTPAARDLGSGVLVKTD
jgi:acetaldehyde dehydrogenase (acetylating)